MEQIRDCQMLLPWLDPGQRVVDVGSGAGLPGLVLALDRPDLRITALEPHRRKWAFLRAARRELAVHNFTPLCLSDEQHVASRDFEPFDVAVSKAAFPPAEWLRRAPSLVHEHGVVLAMLGGADLTFRPDLQVQQYEVGGKKRAIIRQHTKELSQ